MYYLNFPIDLGQEYRRMMISNFKHIMERLNYTKDDFSYHRTEEDNAHTSSQIKHGNRTSKDTFNDLQSQINRLAVAPRDNSANEIVQARVDIFGNHFPTLKEHLISWEERTKVNKEEAIEEVNKAKKEILDIEYRFEPDKQEFLYVTDLGPLVNAVMQHFWIDNRTGVVYMTQATANGYMLTRLKSNGDYIDSSEVISGGHGTHNGYRYIDDEIWIYSYMKDYEGKEKLVRFKYTPNVNISYGTYGMEEVFTGHVENPYITPIINNKEGLILFRIEYPKEEWSTRNAQNYVEIRKLEDIDNRVDNVLYKIDIPAKYSYFGDPKQPMQGVEFDAETLYWYTGNSDPKDNNYLTAFDLNTGKQLYSTVVNYGGISGIYPGDFSEPEGMQLYYDDETDKKALLIGYSVGGSGNRSHKIYGISQRDILEKIKSRGTPVPLTDTGGRTKPLPIDPDNLRLLSKITEPGYYYLYTDHIQNIDDFPLDKKLRDAGWFFQVEPPQANGDVLQRLIRNSYSRNLLTFERFVSKRADNNGKWNLIYKTAGEWERVPIHINKIADLNIVGLTYYMTTDDSKRMSDFPQSKKGISGWIIHVEAGEGGGFVHKVIRNISEVRMEILYKVYHQDGTSSDWWMIPGEKVN
ncbi:phage baseplate protein [Staphylococcus halotolerans]|uniref:phage baseplate protein n=1 Tax=Staphylococcus sp. 50Mo3-2 TaxID=3135642 RepID=UPI003D17B84B